MSISENITESTPLKSRQKLFADEYLIDLNGTQAAIRAGYSPKSAKEIATENLSKPHIRAYVDRKLAERSRRIGINQERVLQELAKLALVNPLDVFDMEKGIIRADVSNDDSAAIVGVKYKEIPTRDGIAVEREIRFIDKNKTLDMLGRHLGMFGRTGSGSDEQGNNALDKLASVIQASKDKHGVE